MHMLLRKAQVFKIYFKKFLFLIDLVNAIFRPRNFRKVEKKYKDTFQVKTAHQG